MKIWRRKDCDKKTELSNVIDPNNAHLTLTLWLQGSCEWGGLSEVMCKMQCQSIVDDVKSNRGVLFWGGSGTLALLLVVLISLYNNILLYMIHWIYDMLLMNFKAILLTFLQSLLSYAKWLVLLLGVFYMLKSYGLSHFLSVPLLELEFQWHKCMRHLWMNCIWHNGSDVDPWGSQPKYLTFPRVVEAKETCEVFWIKCQLVGLFFVDGGSWRNLIWCHILMWPILLQMWWWLAMREIFCSLEKAKKQDLDHHQGTCLFWIQWLWRKFCVGNICRSVSEDITEFILESFVICPEASS